MKNSGIFNSNKKSKQINLLLEPDPQNILEQSKPFTQTGNPTIQQQKQQQRTRSVQQKGKQKNIIWEGAMHPQIRNEQLHLANDRSNLFRHNRPPNKRQSFSHHNYAYLSPEQQVELQQNEIQVYDKLNLTLFKNQFNKYSKTKNIPIRELQRQNFLNIQDEVLNHNRNLKQQQQEKQQNERFISIKYIGVHNDTIGILSRREAITQKQTQQPQSKNLKRLYSYVKKPTHQYNNSLPNELDQSQMYGQQEQKTLDCQDEKQGMDYSQLGNTKYSINDYEELVTTLAQKRPNDMTSVPNSPQRMTIATKRTSINSIYERPQTCSKDCQRRKQSLVAQMNQTFTSGHNQLNNTFYNNQTSLNNDQNPSGVTGLEQQQQAGDENDKSNIPKPEHYNQFLVNKYSLPRRLKTIWKQKTNKYDYSVDVQVDWNIKKVSYYV